MLQIKALQTKNLAAIDIEIASGECVAVMGPSDSGKTLFLRAIADLDPGTGRVTLDGIERKSLTAPEWRRKVCYLPPVTVGGLATATTTILAAAEARKGGYVCVANVHMVTTARKDPCLLAAMEGALWVTSDGMPLVWALRCQGLTNAWRVAGPDLVLRLLQEAEAMRMPVGFFGGSTATIAALTRALKKNFPALVLTGAIAPPPLPLKPTVDAETVARINGSGAHLIFVGLGCPKQEYWMAVHAPHLGGVQIGVGTAFDFFAGTVRRAPRWMQAVGLEWVFRLCAEPRRLWKRYLVTNSLFIWYTLVAWLGSKDGHA